MTVQQKIKNMEVNRQVDKRNVLAKKSPLSSWTIAYQKQTILEFIYVLIGHLPFP